jgi:hypothetical protein
MQTHRFGRKLNLPSTIAIKHQVRKLMADDRAKNAAAKLGAQSTDVPRMNVGPKRGATTQPPTCGQPFAAVLASASSTPAAQPLAKL